MGLSEETEDKIGKIQERYDVLCQSLNLDTKTKDEAWESYNKTREIYTLEVKLFLFLLHLIYCDQRLKSQYFFIFGKISVACPGIRKGGGSKM